MVTVHAPTVIAKWVMVISPVQWGGAEGGGLNYALTSWKARPLGGSPKGPKRQFLDF
jgi:hypothetical protein